MVSFAGDLLQHLQGSVVSVLLQRVFRQPQPGHCVEQQELEPSAAHCRAPVGQLVLFGSVGSIAVTGAAVLVAAGPTRLVAADAARDAVVMGPHAVRAVVLAERARVPAMPAGWEPKTVECFLSGDQGKLEGAEVAVCAAAAAAAAAAVVASVARNKFG